MFSVFASNVKAQPTVDWWSTFRHDVTHTGDSASTAPLTNQLLWNYTTGNSIDYSSPAIVNGIVYVGSTDNYVYALNAATGGTIWSYKTGSSIDSSPAVVNGVVYIGSRGSQGLRFERCNRNQRMELLNWKQSGVFSHDRQQ